MDKKFVILFCIFFQFCYLRTTKSNFQSQSINIPETVYLFSDDLFLLQKVCLSFKEKNIKTICNLNAKFPYKTKEQLINKIYCPDNSCLIVNISSSINESSSDFFRSVGFSLLGLTLWGQITNSAKVEYLVEIKNVTSKEIFSFKHESFGRFGFGLILPIYAGLISTIGGTALNTYRQPDKLKKICHYGLAEINSLKEIELCTEDYYRFIDDSFQRKEKEFFIEFEKNIKTVNQI